MTQNVKIIKNYTIFYGQLHGSFLKFHNPNYGKSKKSNLILSFLIWTQFLQFFFCKFSLFLQFFFFAKFEIFEQ